jgi:hypothetical protein
MKGQRGTMIELYLAPALALVLLAIAGGQWAQGRRLLAGLIGGAGLWILGFVLYALLRGWWEARKDKRD